MFAGVVLFLFPHRTVDDAFITYRYADNLARHGALTWNVGEPAVEGYTGVALPVLLAAAGKVGLTPDPVSKAIGVVSYGLCALFLYLLVRYMRVRRLIAAITVALYLTMPLQFTHALAGLETMLFACGATGAVLALLRCFDPDLGGSRSEITLLVALLVTCLVRPEGLALAGLAVASLLVHTLITDRSRVLPYLLRLMLFLVLPLSAYFFWKWSYYGSLLPNSYYAKLFDGINPVSVGWMEDFWHRYMSFVTVGCGILWFWPMARVLKQQDRIKKLGLTFNNLLWIGVILAVMVASGCQYARSYLYMNYSFRFFVPFYPMYLAVLGLLADRGFDRTLIPGIGTRWYDKLVVGLAVLIISIQCYRHMEHLPGEFGSARSGQQLIEKELAAAGQYLKETLPGTEWLAVCIDAGAIPYYSQLKTIDMGNLNDPTLARGQLTDEEALDYVFGHRPGAWTITSRSADSLVYPRSAMSPANDPRFDKYVLTEVFRP